ncbi:acyltransferase [Devosia sp. ZB163]|uniref:acyltransferase family protein n=1 Tax=Devosia sp. ZB163 TaxID=3025938 RepID=UPI002361074C|nr:acyltransferase [Devosia sp. ZB163]MDC9824003.1 acyltransferase [Devosia sp. ZB163]
MPASRLDGADFLRAAACLTVLFHHLAQRMSWRDDLTWMEWFRPFAQMGTFGVAMFFVLSGFLLARPFWQALDKGEAMPSLRTYAIRRAARILPGFWLALAVTFVLSITVFGFRLDSQLVLRFLAGFFTVADWHWVTLFPVEVNGPLWSISFEVTSYVLLPLCFVLLFWMAGWLGQGWQSRLAWIGVIALALFAHWLFARYYRVDMRERGWDYGLIGGAKYWMPRYNPFAFFAMFAVGALAAGIQVRWARHRNFVFDVLALAALAWGMERIMFQMGMRNGDSWGWLGVPYGFPWFVLACGLFLAAAPSSAMLGRLLDNPAARYVARISFGIYVWHYPVLELVRIFWDPQIDHGAATEPMRFLITSTLITLITIVVAHLSYYMLEEPVIRWARGKERRPLKDATFSPAAS